MKFPSPARSTSFYESFSDLIFATMAIFVLVIIVLIIQVRPEGVPSDVFEDIQQQLAQRQEQAEELQAAIDAKTEQVKKLEEKIEDAIVTKPIELAVVIDGSGSMEGPLVELDKALKTVAEVVPLISQRFTLGVTVYRDRLNTFGPTEIRARDADNGNSLQAFYRFAADFKPRSSAADIQGAIGRAVQSFSPSDANKILLVIGDVGPYETAVAGAASQNPSIRRRCPDSNREQATLAAVRGALQRYENLSLVSLYSGNSGIDCHRESQAFFNALANLDANSGQYLTDSEKILPTLLSKTLGVRL